MDRQYILENDVVEKYLLGRLSDQDKLAYEAWLEKNSQGKTELEEQRLLLGGLRQVGRADMKAEIRRQTEAARAAQAMRSRQSDFNWGMMLRVAAILLIVVAAPSLYYFTRINTPEVQSTGAFDTEVEGLMPALAEDEAAENDAVEMERRELSEMTAEEPVTGRSRAAKRKEAVAASPPPAAEEAVVDLGEGRQDAVADLTSSIASGSGSSREALSDNRQSNGAAGATADGDLAVLRDQPEPELRKKANEKIELPGQPAKPSVKSSVAKNAPSRDFAKGGGTATVFSYMPKSSDILDEKYDAYMHQNAVQYKSEDDRFKIPSFHFSSGDESIIVRYLLSEKKLRNKIADVNAGFDVFLDGKAEDKLSMSWRVDRAFFDIPLEKIKLVRMSNELLEVVVDDSLRYQIDIQGDSTRAVRLK